LLLSAEESIYALPSVKAEESEKRTRSVTPKATVTSPVILNILSREW
jgi:hypothetical protein